MIQIVVPLAGEGSRFIERGYTLPKPLIDVAGRPMIASVVENLRPRTAHKFVFVCRNEHLEQFPLEELLEAVSPGCRIVPVRSKTEGAACTVLLAADELATDRELIIANCDQMVELALDRFILDARSKSLDGSILTFPASDPKWSYAKPNRDGFVTEVAEKRVISPHATVGVYYFRKTGLFFDGACSMIEKDIRVNGEFYVCPIYNEVIQSGARVGIYQIEQAQMHGIGTPDDLNAYLEHLRSGYAVTQ